MCLATSKNLLLVLLAAKNSVSQSAITKRIHSSKPASLSRTHVAFRLQALVYDILPLTAAIVDKAIGLEKLSANEQFFDDNLTAVSL